MCDLYFVFFDKIVFYYLYQDGYRTAFGVLFTCKGVLICTFLSPVGLSSPARLTKARPESQAHSTTHILA